MVIALRCPSDTRPRVIAARYDDGLPLSPKGWGARYDEINAFERELVDGGTTLVKVAMFISPEEQKT